MDISYFREFVVLAETQNYWATAERLYIGESSLSKHIKALEKHLGAPLFHRTSRKVTLTEFGERMLPYAQSISKLQYEYEAAAFNYLQEGEEKLNIASIPAMPQYGIVDILIRFQRDYPKVQIHTQEADTLALREWLLERKFELAFLRDSVAYLEHDPDKETQLIKLPFERDRLVVVLPNGHPLAAEKQIELTQLAEEQFALIKKDTMPYNLCMRVCKEAGFVPEVLFSSHNLNAVLDMVTRGTCISLLFEHHVNVPVDSVLSLEPPFSVVPIHPEIRTTVFLTYLKGRQLSPAAEHFIDYCMIKRKEEIDSK